MKIVSENLFSGKNYFHTIGSRLHPLAPADEEEDDDKDDTEDKEDKNVEEEVRFPVRIE